MQPQGQVQILINIIHFGMNVQEAGDAARWRHDGSSTPQGYKMTNGGSVALESGICESVRNELRRRGHVLNDGGAFGGYQAILYDSVNGVYHGASEMRKDGMAAGY